MWSDLFGAVSFLTIAPLGGRFSGAVAKWFFVAGAIVGLVEGVVFWVGSQAFGTYLGALLAVVTDVVVTGGLHYDAIGDFTDGLMAHVDRERRLEIMRDPHIGSFGVVALVLVVAFRVGSFVRLAPTLSSVLGIVGVVVLSRAMMGIGLVLLKSARQSGLATTLGTRVGGFGEVLITGVGAVVGLIILFGAVGFERMLMIAIGQVVVTIAMWMVSLGALGGATGDVLGASSVFGEIVGLVCLGGVR